VPGSQSVELLYFAGCPHHEAFLPHLRGLLADTTSTTSIRLVEITSDEDAYRRQFLGSPTLRINGVDVDPSAAERTDYGVQCRLYRTEGVTRGTPPDSWIIQALSGPASQGDQS
jgi:hypothetical protein